jgi:hypothetical protein
MNLRTFLAGLLLISDFCNAGSLEPNIESRALGLTDIPGCGVSRKPLFLVELLLIYVKLQCIFLTVPASGCSLDDNNCICTNAELARTLSACMLANCTMADTLGAIKVQADICNFSRESKRTEMFMYTGIIYPLAIFLVALRIAGKIVLKHLSMDDGLVVSSLLLLALPVGCVLEMTKIGFGKHLWDLQDGELLRILRFCKSVEP